MAFCPSCRQEYDDGVATCADCGVPLTAEAPRGDAGGPEAGRFRAEDAAALATIRAVLDASGVPHHAAPSQEGADAPAVIHVPPDLLVSTLRVLDRVATLQRLDPPRASGAADDPDAGGADPGADEAAPSVTEPESLPRYGSCEAAPPPEIDRELAAKSLRELAALGAAHDPALREIVLRGEPPLRDKVVGALRMRGPAGVEMLCALLAVAADESREAVAFSIANELRENLRDARALAAVLDVAVDAGRDPEPRLLALHAVGRIALAGVEHRVAPLLDDPVPEVREAADEALCSISDDDLGFDPDLPADERRRFVQRWLERFRR